MRLSSLFPACNRSLKGGSRWGYPLMLLVAFAAFSFYPLRSSLSFAKSFEIRWDGGYSERGCKGIY